MGLNEQVSALLFVFVLCVCVGGGEAMCGVCTSGVCGCGSMCVGDSCGCGCGCGCKCVSVCIVCVIRLCVCVCMCTYLCIVDMIVTTHTYSTVNHVTFAEMYYLK